MNSARSVQQRTCGNGERFSRWLLSALVLLLCVPLAFSQPAEPGSLFYFAVENLDTGTVIQRGVTGPTGFPPSGLITAPNTRHRYWLLEAATGLLGYQDFRTPSAGLTFNIPRVALGVPLATDSDGDGLTDDAEFIVGTNPLAKDTNGDGIEDGAAIRLGLDASNARTGVIGSANTPSPALDICAVDDLAIVACGDAGIVVFNVFNRMNPVRISQVDTPGTASRVACSGNLVAVADGSAGLAIIDINDPPNAHVLHQVALSSSAVAVAASGGIAYVALANGQIAAVDLASGAILERLSVGSDIHDLGIEGDVLFVLRAAELVACSLSDIGLRVLGRASSLSFFAEGITQSRRLFVGAGTAYITSYPGYDTYDVREPGNMRKLGSAQDRGPNSFKQIVANGSGLGVAAVGNNPRPDGTHDISLYNLTNAAVTTAFVTTLPTPGVARSVSLYNGLAYVADSEAGMQVVNYLAADTKGRPPNISLSASFSLNPPEAEENKLVRVTASVGDDVQVRNVEFYVDGVRIATDGNFPFEHRFLTPARATRGSFILQARVSDTGGNATFSESFVVSLVPDRTPPQVVRVLPEPGAILGSVSTVAAFFSEPMSVSALHGSTFRLRFFGPDGIPQTADDAVITSGALSYRNETKAAFMTFDSVLQPGLYEVSVQPPLSDLSGNSLASAFTWTFTVIGGQDADQDGLPDAVELAMGLDPQNSDSDGDGIPDGLEDADNDGLRNAGEVLLGLDPRNADTDGNGINDGHEDFDRDSLSNAFEIQRGTNPRLADSDGDGWPDEGELTTGSNPLDAASTPFMFTVAVPPIQVLAPAAPPITIAQLGTTVAQPPLQVLAPAPVNLDLGAMGTIFGQPPVTILLPGAVGLTVAEMGTVAGQPPVQILAPLSNPPGAGDIGTVVGQPPVQILAPSPSGEVITGGTTLAQPPVSVILPTQ